MFDDFLLDERLLKGLAELGITEPTPVQVQTIPLALEHKDLLVCAETGSGKSAAFLLPIFQRLLDQPAPDTGTRALILAPTRELARQLLKNCKQLGGFTHLQFGLISGGESFKFQRALFRKNPELIIATPGRLLEHIEHGTPDLSDLEVLVLDEADRMLDMGFKEDVLRIVSSCNKERQTMLLSATLSQRGLGEMSEQVLREPERVELDHMRDPHRNIRQQMVLSDDSQHKTKQVAWLLANETFEKALVFTNTRVQADALGQQLGRGMEGVAVLHGECVQDERKLIMQRYRLGGIKVLVATDVAARGLDVKGIDLVINFDVPRSGKEYVHRIGRTGRGGEEGLAISLVNHQQWNLMGSIERYLRLDLEQRVIKALIGKFKGPKKSKPSKKTAGVKKKKATKERVEKKAKQRHRNKKDIGKRRVPSKGAEVDVPAKEGGNRPMKRKG